MSEMVVNDLAEMFQDRKNWDGDDLAESADRSLLQRVRKFIEQ
jgi:hypothetical protein